MLEKNIELLMDYVDDLSQETNKYINYQRNVGKVQMAKQQYIYKRVSNKFTFCTRCDNVKSSRNQWCQFKSCDPNGILWILNSTNQLVFIQQ